MKIALLKIIEYNKGGNSLNASVNKRLKSLEKKTSSANNYRDIINLIKAGAFYDEISELEQIRYCEYQGFEKNVIEQVYKSVFEENAEPLHFNLELRPKPLSEEELKKRIDEVEKIVKECEKNAEI